MAKDQGRRFQPKRTAKVLALGAGLALGVITYARPHQTTRSDPGRDAQTQVHQQTTQGQVPANSDASRKEHANFERFLNSHPIMERQLESNPSLVNDPNYVKSEPDLGIYLSHHPDIKSELERDPNALLPKEVADVNAANRSANLDANQPLNGADAGLMSQFLDQHRDVDEQLKQNPPLIDDQNFLAQHEDLKALLNNHGQFERISSRTPHISFSGHGERT